MTNAVKRILHLTDDWTELRGIADSIIEGHLRDSIAAMTPEEVMSQKDQLIQHMIRVAKSDLEEIGLEITTMNIADVDDHRLEGVDEPDLYIALLKRVQTANAETQSRTAKADATATATEEQEARRADVEVRALENERQQIDAADTGASWPKNGSASAVGVQQATRNAESEVAGILAQIEAEKQRIEMVTQQLKANVIVPAEAQKVRKIEDAKAQVADVRLRGQAELDQLRQTVEILESGDGQGTATYLIEVFARTGGPIRQCHGPVPGGAYLGDCRTQSATGTDLGHPSQRAGCGADETHQRRTGYGPDQAGPGAEDRTFHYCSGAVASCPSSESSRGHPAWPRFPRCRPAQTGPSHYIHPKSPQLLVNWYSALFLPAIGGYTCDVCEAPPVRNRP